MQQERDLDWIDPAHVAAVAAIVAAVIAALAAIASALTAYRASERSIRANVVSTNRQKWIDAIRDDFAEFLSSHEIAYLYHGSSGTNAALAEEAKVARRRMYFLKNRIQLRLNPDEEPHIEFLDLLDEMREMNTPWSVIEPKTIRSAQDIFKAEWEVIKRVD